MTLTAAPTTTAMSSFSLKPHHHIFLKYPRPKPLSFQFINTPYFSLHFNRLNSSSITSTCRLQFSSFHSNFYRHKQHFCRPAYDSGDGQKVDLGNNFNFDYLLSVGELVCLVSSVVISVIFAVKRRVFGAMGSRVLILAVAMLALGAGFGVWIRKRQWRRVFMESVRSSGGGSGGEGLNLVERVEKLEEDLRSSMRIVRVLSRQLEKLGIRFRVTRKALKEPIAETAALAQKNSEATRALAIQEDILEKELGEIQKVLLAMQEQQQKQLDLILAIGKTGKLWEAQAGPDQEERTNEVYSWTEDGVKQTEIHQTPASSISKVSENDMA